MGEKIVEDAAKINLRKTSSGKERFEETDSSAAIRSSSGKIYIY
jgi:hypothetical protein